MRERRGVLTTTISHYGDRIDTLTGQVAALRTEESAVEVRLDAKQAELDRALGELGVAKQAPRGGQSAPAPRPGRPARAARRDL